MTDVQHTVLDTNNGWSGTALGAYAYGNGTRGMLMRVYNWTDGTDVSPSGTENECSLGVYVDKTGKAYCKASTSFWANSFIPHGDEAGLIGVEGQKWYAVHAKYIYADTFMEIGRAVLNLI